MGTSPEMGLISVPIFIQSLGHAAMQRPQPLQNSGNTKGFGLSLVCAISLSFLNVQIKPAES
jgi:hypothetical protein